MYLQIANIFTKALPRNRHEFFKEKLLLIWIPQHQLRERERDVGWGGGPQLGPSHGPILVVPTRTGKLALLIILNPLRIRNLVLSYLMQTFQKM